MTTRRRWLLGVLVPLLGLACGAGCDFASLPAFLVGTDSKEPPLLKKLASDDKNKQVTVVVLTYSGMDARPEFVRADRDLSNLVVKQLRESYKANNEKVQLVSPSKVEEFKSNHPGWKRLGLAEIGSRFNADYVVYLEIGHLSMYEPNSANTLYHGRAELTVTLADVNHPDEDPESREVAINYPSDSVGGQVPADEKTPQLFKAEFFNRIATQVAWHFTSHLTSDEYGRD